MQQSNPATEDIFEKAREAFFGTTKMVNKSNDYSSDLFKPRYEAPANTNTNNSSD